MLNNLLAMFCFIIITIGASFILGFLFSPDSWYAGLAKPFFNPPNTIFAPVWTVLYIMIGVAGWWIWIKAPKSILMVLWCVQMILNWLWVPIFFGAHNIIMAFFVILLLFFVIIIFIIRAIPRNKVAAYLFIPYGIWVGFASILNGAILILNH